MVFGPSPQWFAEDGCVGEHFAQARSGALQRGPLSETPLSRGSRRLSCFDALPSAASSVDDFKASPGDELKKEGDELVSGRLCRKSHAPDHTPLPHGVGIRLPETHGMRCSGNLKLC